MRLKLNSLLAAPLVVSLACFFVPGEAFARASFKITGATVKPGAGVQIIQKYFPTLANQQGAAAQLETLMNNAIEGARPTLENQVNSNLTALQDPSEFLGAMASSGAAAGKVMSFDYATDPTIFSLSVAGGVAEKGVSLNDINHPDTLKPDPSKPLQGKGGALTLSALLGINLRGFNPPRWSHFDLARLSLFVNFFAIDQSNINNDGIDVNFKTFGLHGMYQLFDSQAIGSHGLLRWGGLSVGTGFDYSSLTVLYDATLDSQTTQTLTDTIPGTANQKLPLNLTYGGDINLGADIHIFSIPIEVMTHVQLGYLLTIYASAGFDLNFGSASLAGGATAPIEIDAVNPDTPQSTADTVIVSQPTGTLDLGGNSSVAVGDFRGLVGAQINLFAVAIFAQLGADTTSTISANGGLRIFW